MKIVELLIFLMTFFLMPSCNDENNSNQYELRDITDYKLATSDLRIRDPFIIVDQKEKCYYLIAPRQEGTIYSLFAYQSLNLKTWKEVGTVYEMASDYLGTKDYWAPDFFKYKDNYYCFITVSGEGIKRGTTIFKGGVSPVDTYTPMLPNTADGMFITPGNQQYLDGSLYVDEQGIPWMVYSHEWLEATNYDGEIYAVQLKDDLSGTIGEPIKLFSASEVPWVVPWTYKNGSGEIIAKETWLTDAPFIWKDEASGNLIMTWSSLSSGDYSIGQAISETGKMTGPWKHETTPIYSSDGGHAMIFKDLEGRLKIAYHAPNSVSERVQINDITITNGKIDRFDRSTYDPTRKINTADFEVLWWNLPTSPDTKYKDNKFANLFDENIYTSWISLHWWVNAIKHNGNSCPRDGNGFHCHAHDHLISDFGFASQPAWGKLCVFPDGQNDRAINPILPPYILIIDMKSSYVLKNIETMTAMDNAWSLDNSKGEYSHREDSGQKIKEYEYWISNDDFIAPEDWSNYEEGGDNAGWTKLGENSFPVVNTTYQSVEAASTNAGRYLKLVIKTLHFREQLDNPKDNNYAGSTKSANMFLGPVNLSEIRVKGYKE